jgi:drug/metabolite transporter (DMT)-like permease
MGATARSARIAGIGLMLASIALFSLGDAIGKFLVADYPVGQFMMLRGIASLLLLAPFIWRTGLQPFLTMPRPGLQCLRMTLSVGDIGLFFWAASLMPLADVITFYLAGPIYVTAISALFLGEKVGWRRWSAVVAGFVGVLVAMQPSAATLTGPALIAFAGSLCFTGFMLMTRAVRGTTDLVLTATHLGATMLFGAALSVTNFVMPAPRDALLYLAGGLVSIGALLCLNRSLKLATAGVVVPYQYTMILWAILFGYAVFGDIPTIATLTGAAIIAAAGLYIFLRERAVGQQTAAETISPPP